jgi:hypothetical protein
LEPSAARTPATARHQQQKERQQQHLCQKRKGNTNYSSNINRKASNRRVGSYAQQQQEANHSRWASNLDKTMAATAETIIAKVTVPAPVGKPITAL